MTAAATAEATGIATQYGRFALGLILALSNAVLSSSGFALQRKAQLMIDQAKVTEDVAARSAMVQKLGIVLYVLAAVPDVWSYTLIPQVVCTTVACFRLVLVTFLAHTFLEEEVKRTEVIGMGVCTLGTFLCLVFGPRPEDVKEDKLEQAFYHPQVWTYLVVGLAVLAVLLAVEHVPRLIGASTVHPKIHYFTLPVATGLAFALEKVFNTEIGFVDAPEGLNNFFAAPLWCMMIVAIAALGLTDFYLNMRGAASMPVQVFLPTAFALSTALQFFQSIVIFREFEEMTPLNSALSIIGAVVSLLGTLLIKPPRFDLLSSGSPAEGLEELNIRDDIELLAGSVE